MGFLYVPNSYFEKSTCRSTSWKFYFSEEGKLITLDFGCMKSIPDEFYIPYFELAAKR